MTVLTVEWTPGLFVIFGTAWVGFTLLAFLISSVKLAAKVEDIYVQAALAISEDSDPGKKVEKELRAAAEAAGVDFLDPVEKAEIIRLLASRKVPIAGMTAALKMVERLHVLTKVPSMTYADFVADIYWSILRSSSSNAVLTLDGIYAAMKSSAVPPQDFIEGYRATRHLVLSGEIGITTQFDLIRDLLEQGYPVHRLEEGIRACLP